MIPYLSLLLLVLTLVAPVGPALRANSQTTEKQSSKMKVTPLSDREKRGLRGPVKSCGEEHTYLGTTIREGRQQLGVKSWNMTEYDLEGRVVSTRWSNSDGSEFVTQYTYDLSGRLLKMSQGNETEKLAETVYSYGDDGRLLKVTNSRTADNPVVFRYDDHGSKTKVQASRAADYRPNLASNADALFESADTPPNLPGGGTATTIYDEQDRPVEVQVRDANGELVSRALRTYDAEGRVAEEKDVLQSPEMLIPAEQRAKILQAAREQGEPPEEVLKQLRAQLTTLMGGQSGVVSVSHEYDSQGRIKQTRRRVFNREQQIDITYNQQGDKLLEITRESALFGENPDATAPLRPTYSEVRYSYKYDERGNWTEQAVSYRSSPDDTFGPPTVTTRTLTHY
jgi:YD repeat-containing protein